MDKPFKTFIIDALNSFSASDSVDKRWETANRLIQEQAGTAINIGAVKTNPIVPIWMLSSMSKAWLKQYADENLIQIDPFIPHMLATNKPFALDTTKTVKTQPLNSKLLAAGYRFLYGMPFNGVRQGERQIVSYCTSLTLAELLKTVSLERIRMLAAILITQFSSPNQRSPDVVEYFERNLLTPREKETLVWLANGLRNDRIAERMGISEITVRKHMFSARQKLGASTREQALGQALHLGLIDL